ncbi:sulfite reductase subunit alpha NDAI_0G02080 [Naumovozyma dairenensis CBS 421]|uniref:assimilatory sulfite reductase (NADPH) n=1 Tax=Naumovozyma dairenensis (strain ATCC 10597 / BCRC 20456 / CBS 421 / NBRC 0211 / NRRL Y-12639) TaxID=1071378 RepID=G0WDX2_NAUDC|nr:hypothetical protein NDAI_0G02080 [Naumovozyma dairenensis CBS 421]CCD25983.2 hypothetical protein NDAI_0G02080 [Naumovozyma dairenensis CBS 421]
MSAATALATNPFGSPKSSKELPAYSTPLSIINSAIYENVNNIFAYNSFSNPELLHSYIKSWLQNANNTDDKFFKEFDIRSGAGLGPLGFIKSQQNSVIANPHTVSTIITPSYGLPFFYDALSSAKANILLNVGALNYNQESGSIINDYSTSLNFASSLNYNVLTPISNNEVSNLTSLSVVLSKFGLKTMNLFDSINYSNTIIKTPSSCSASPINVQDVTLKLSKLVSTPNPSFNEVLEKFNELTGAKLHNFHYSGNFENPKTVFVTYGSLESQLFNSFMEENSNGDVGIISIRIPLPFDLEKFIALIPNSTKNLIFINQKANNSNLIKSNISAALFYFNRHSINFTEYLYDSNFIWSPNAVSKIISSFTSTSIAASNSSQGFIYYSNDKSENIDLFSKLAISLSEDNNEINLRTKFDNILNAGTFQAQLSINNNNNNRNGNIISNIDTAEISIVEDVSILKNLNVLNTLKQNGTLIINTKENFEFVQDSIDTFVKGLNLSLNLLNQLIENIKLIIVKYSDGENFSIVNQAVFYKILGAQDIVSKIVINDPEFDRDDLPSILEKAFAEDLIEIENDSLSNLVKQTELDIENEKKEQEQEQEQEKEKTEQEEEEQQEEEIILPSFVNETSFVPNTSTLPKETTTNISNSTEISKILSFKESYGVNHLLRPDLPIKNFIVKVKSNKRVTPEDYDRYIFEINFDISNTPDLKYDIGEALGIHAENNSQDVQEFLQFYNLSGNEIIMVPNKDNNKILEARTSFQAFKENLDLFGKPPKRFYESLIDYAEDEEDKTKLQELISPAGAVDLKRYQDVEFYTYVDILKLYPSCKPSLSDLTTLIAPLKRREYSIASSQRVHPTEIHLLIVVVDWVDNQGRKRFGQASKFISDLKVGQELVVSVKPSVMKLPPSPLQPVIMSGLGTGLAPFKAIVEEKLWQKQHGMEIGEVYLYMGSRHRREEYLFGELWEAYKDAGIITHIGAAFSRDQPEKIYIQDRIRENLSDLKTAMIDKNGSFYLCGPTWPVPDITKALQDIIEADAKEKGIKVDLNAAIEELKESSRYILEVY